LPACGTNFSASAEQMFSCFSGAQYPEKKCMYPRELRARKGAEKLHSPWIFTRFSARK
jgi:hypothetical protein